MALQIVLIRFLINYSTKQMNNKNLEEDSEGSSDLDLENFRASVSFPLVKLQQIVYNDQKYSATIISFIRQGLKKIKRQELQYALVYFTEGEKILQYGANCGRTIDRSLIICVLHNEACCYQKINDLSKASKYIEAIIFNLKAHIRSIQSTPTNSNLFEPPVLRKALPEPNCVPMKKRLELAHYLLQFCSVSSQLKARKVALQSAKNALQLYKVFFLEFKAEKKWEHFAYGNHIDRQKIKECLSDFKTFKQEIDTSQIDQYLKIVRYYVKKWKIAIHQSSKTMIDKMLGGYSIGNFVQLEPLQYEEYDEKINSQIEDCEENIKELLHYSMGYFQMATEYRLMVEEKYKIDPGAKYNSQEFKLSNIYHLYAILFIAMYIPYEILFMEQIISSYQHHYKNSIADSMVDTCKINLTLIFDPQTKKSQPRKRKISEMKVVSKKRKKSAVGFNSKQVSRSRIKHGCHEMTPSAKDQYFAQGTTVQHMASRAKRNHSSHSRKSDKSEKKKKIHTQPGETITIASGYKRSRMKTKVSEHPQRVKQKERMQGEYCAFPFSIIKQRRESVQRFNSKIEKGGRKNSCQHSDGMSPKFRKVSYEKHCKKTVVNCHRKNKEKQPKKILSPISPKKGKFPQLKQKKKKQTTITNYYI